jgi:hypothetical protein
VDEVGGGTGFKYRLPRFEDYPVTAIFKGQPDNPILATVLDHALPATITWSAMSEPGVCQSRIVRWEVLHGLPVGGPIPMHFHIGNPSQWAAGFVVRFWSEDGTDWVGNFQHDNTGRTLILDWPEASAIAVDAAGCVYLVDTADPAEYSVIGLRSFGGGITLNQDRTKLFVADRHIIHAYGTDRRQLWKSAGLGGSIASITGCLNGVLSVEVAEKTGPW